MVHEILYASGKKVGSFTSPFVTTSIEKIRVNDVYIAPDELADIVDYLRPFIDQAYAYGPYGGPSYFELFFIIAIIYFKQQKCEWVVLEVGLGGMYDATNCIEKPVITAITTIDYDHTEVLGKTLQKIARDKAGIIKTGSVFFTTEQRPSLLKLFKNICARVGARYNHIPQQIDYYENNKALATVICKTLGVEDAHIKNGIQKTHLQCRFETIQKNPLVILDGAHNRAKILSTVNNIKKLTWSKLYAIISIANNKDHVSILEHIIPLADHVYITCFRVTDRKCAHPKELLLKATPYLKKGATSEMFLDPQQALKNALKNADKKDLIVVTGSFFLAGELRKNWHGEEEILRKRKSF